MLKVVKDGSEGQTDELARSLDDLAREGARRMLAAALEAEAAAYVERCRGARDEDGRALVVRNGRARARRVTVGSGTVEIAAPRVNDRRVDDEGKRKRFTSAILPPYMRRSPRVAEVLPILYLRGLSTGDFREAPSNHPDFDFEFNDPIHFVGGTGRFSGATGGGVTNSLVDRQRSRTQHVLTGTLTLPRGK